MGGRTHLSGEETMSESFVFVLMKCLNRDGSLSGFNESLLLSFLSFEREVICEKATDDLSIVSFP